jgi:hypothetical protein
LLHDARVPPWRRARYPLVYWNGNLAVVPGIAVAADAAERFATGGANPARERACWFIAIDLALDR